MRQIFKIIGTILATTFLSVPAYAEYPDKSIKIVVPYAPGGSLDSITRIVAEQLSVELNQPVIVENKAGASGMIGTDFVAKSKPDGYTLVTAANSLVDVPVVYGNAPYNWKTDLQPISLMISIPNVIIVRKDSPIISLSDLIHIARTKPGTVTIADAGAGTNLHMTGELIGEYTGVKFVPVHYKGSAPALLDLLAGSVDVQIDQLSSAVSSIMAGNIRALGITSKTKSQLLPNVIPINAQGIKGLENFSFITHMALFGPSGMPSEVSSKLNSAMVLVLKTPSVISKLEKLGYTVNSSTPQEVTDILNKEEQEVVPLIKKLNIKAN